MDKRRLDRGILSTSALCGVGVIATAAALAALTAPAVAQDENITEDTIVVTGTRIERPALNAPAPITSIGDIDISRSGETDLVGLLNEIPALVGSQDNDDATNLGIGTTGVNTLSLRNLGAERTLVLVNGRRHVGGTGSSTEVNINTIPVALIERVDVLTGGASSIYGADAVTGAVNFILKDDFEGVEVRGQGGFAPKNGDAENYFGSVIAGKNFHEGRGNITVSFEYSNQDGIFYTDREYASSGAFDLVTNPDFGVNGDRRRQILAQDLTIRFASPEGATAIAFGDGFNLNFDFNGAGDPFDPGQVVTFRNAIGGDTTPVALFTSSITSDVERYVANINTHYDFAENVRGFLEVKFAQVSAFSEGQPAFGDLIPILVNENPFTPQSIVDAAAAAATDTAYISHDYVELGLRGEDIRRRTYRIAGGLETKIFQDTFDDLNLDISGVYGRTEERFFATNNLVLDRFYAAMDAVIDPSTGQPTCRTNLDPSATPPLTPFGTFDAFNDEVSPATFGTTPFFTPGPNSGCEALNLFGRGNASQAAIDFVTDDSLRTASIRQIVLNATVSGDTGGVFEMPTDAGPISFAAGIEYRKEESEDIPPVIDTQGFTFGNAISPTFGDYNVFEGFAEVSVPILKDRPGVEYLAIDASARASDYSTISQALAWNAALVYAPVEDIRIRGGYSVAVRAPNISELFTAQNQSFSFPDDPCDVDNLTLGADPALRAANCTLLLSQLGVDASTFEGDDILNASVDGILGGNPNLSEEKATTYTIGAVIRPRWIENLSLTVDYFNIELTDGIISPVGQDIVDQCVDLPSIDNPFCALVDRRADGGLSFIRRIPVNVAFFETSGIDFDLNYFFDPADVGADNIGQFRFRVFGSYLESLSIVSLPGQEPDDERNEIDTLLGDDAPVFTGAVDMDWIYNDFTLGYRFRYRDRIFRDEQDEFASVASQGDILFEPAQTSAVATHDVQLRYQVRDEVEIYAGVNNMLNQEPDIGFTGTPVGPIGRFIYAGFQLNFN